MKQRAVSLKSSIKFKTFGKIDKGKRDKTQTTIIRNEAGDVITDPVHI